VQKSIALDEYVIRVLMRDLTGHDRHVSAFLVYLYLAGECELESQPAIAASHNDIAEATGLSKSAVQKAIRHLNGRKLIRSQKESATAVPRHRVLKPWRR
jgi:DNA-binding MarR family transcriptional regulator